MSNRFALMLLGILFATFAWLRWTGDVRVYQGTPYTYDAVSGSTITGTLLVSPYGVEDDLIDLLSETKYSLDMWMYLFTSKEIIQVVKNLATLGVDVDIVLENNVYGGGSKEYTKLVSTLTPLGVEIQSDEHLGTNFVHAKTLLLDERTYIISTANLGYTGFWRNREYRFIGSHPDIAKSLHILFEKDRNNERILFSDVHPALLVCPLDCRKKMIDLIRSAQTSIEIQAQYIEDESLVAALKKKTFDGIDVRIMVGEHQDEGWLESFGTGVRTMNEYYLHAKNMLIDDEQLVMGSMNFSTNALDNNREIGIIIDDEHLVRQYGKQFQRDREKAKQ